MELQKEGRDLPLALNFTAENLFYYTIFSLKYQQRWDLRQKTADFSSVLFVWRVFLCFYEGRLSVFSINAVSSQLFKRVNSEETGHLLLGGLSIETVPALHLSLKQTFNKKNDEETPEKLEFDSQLKMKFPGHRC